MKVSINEATASSVYAYDHHNYGPQRAISEAQFYHSKSDDSYPWLQFEFPYPYKVSSLKIINRRNCCGERLRNLEIRAGYEAVQSDFRGQISTNEIVGTFEGPGQDGEEINIYTDTWAKYLTFQILGGKETLQIEEVTIFATDEKPTPALIY